MLPTLVRSLITKCCAITIILLAVSFSGLAMAGNIDPASLKFFETKIRPLFSDQCFKCHGEKKQKANLRLDSIQHILQGGDGGAAVMPGDANGSLLMKAVSYTDADLQMPPDNKLDPEQIKDLERWISLGAPWPQNDAPQASAQKTGEFTDADRAWWAFQPVKKTEPPALQNSKPSGARQIAEGNPRGEAGGPSQFKVHNSIDAFIVARLQQENLPQSPAADRLEFARRVYFDLHGLPPTPEELKAYIDDERTDADARLIDKLLESPLYGERWGQHWLDLVRYGESDGYRQDAYRPDAWRFRDYVVKSFNTDKPYDRFVREQLAGDELDPGNPDALIGTAYLRQSFYEYNSRDAEGQRTTILNDITDTTGELFLGLSFACARCHDHKFDPVLQKDYYRLQAFFAPLIWRDDLPLGTADEIGAYEKQKKAWEDATAAPRKRLETALRPLMELEMRNGVKKFPDPIQALTLKPDTEKTAYEKQIAYFVLRQGYENQLLVKPSRLRSSERAVYDEAQRQMRSHANLKPHPLPLAFVATDVGRDSPPTVLKTRKDGEQPIEPGFLSILSPGNAQIEPPKNLNSTGRRAALANWITQPDNQLATRVIVNRVWQHHFGRGLVPTGSDFGRLGEKPSHPELLDWLASEFVAHGWSFKWLHRTIMNTATYRQTARVAPDHIALKKDPRNRLLWRMNPVRLDAEQAHDALLAISGELDTTTGGPGVESSQTRRSIYTRKIRNSQDELLRSFDAPPGFQSVSERDATNTALQSLLMINGDWPLHRARSMAARLIKEIGNSPEIIVSRAYELAYSRPPTAAEITAATRFLRTQSALPTPDAHERKHQFTPIDPLVDAKPFFGRHPLGGVRTVAFKPGGAFEKLRVETDEMESDTFTVEAVIYLDSVYADSAVRTIASRWNNDKNSKGWAIGVTGKDSKYQANNLVMQLCGNDSMGEVVYEVAASNIHIPLKTPYYIAAVVSPQSAQDRQPGGTITYYTKNLADPLAKMESVTVTHPIVGGYSNPDRALFIGGRDHDARSLWDGMLSRVSVRRGALDEEELLVSKPQGDRNCLVDAQAESIGSTRDARFFWERSTNKPGNGSSELDALTDFCHVLINSNEFLYLN